ncbi:hypothetical protein EPO15_08640 [bacterium]|nr:MAG: hypothetical protein EPO15_08640 [bacterium]
MAKQRRDVSPALPQPAAARHWAVAALLAAVFAARLLHAAALKSPSYDEALYLVYGHALWETGDFRLSIDKPPLVPWVAGLGPKLLGASFDRADEDWRKADLWLTADSPWKGLQDHRWRFFLKDLHKNAVPEERLLFWSRAALIALNAAAMLAAFALAAALFGPAPALWLTFFLSAEPSLLAHAGLVGEDATVASLMLLSALSLLWTLKAPSAGRGALFGALTAAALLAKHNALTLGPAYVLVLGAAGALGALPAESRPRLARALGSAAAAAAGVFLALYLVKDVGFYWLAVKNTLAYQARGQATYLFGRVSYDGFWLTYPACLLLKLTPGLLVLPAAWLARKDWDRREALWTAAVLVPAAVLVGVASANKIQLGLRYILPAVSLLAVPAALAAARRPWLGLALGAWTGLASVAATSDTLAYFNLLGGSEPWRKLSDSNVDWGQDLWALRDYVRSSGADEVVLSYYGATVPEAVGFPFQDLYSFGVWGEKAHLGGPKPQKELLAVSATNRVGLYLARALGPDPFAWLDARKPEAVLGGSILVYDVTLDADAHANLARLYAAGGMDAHAAREAQRAKALSGR